MKPWVTRCAMPCAIVGAVLAAGAACAPAGPAPASTPETRRAAAADASVTLDSFDELSPWRARSSDGVEVRLEAAPGVTGGALGLAFDFRGLGGHAAVRRKLPLRLPDNYELSFDLRGAAPANDLELKLIDASGDNVWWFRQRDAAFTPDWRRIVVKKRQIEFAWGPTRSRELREVAAVEFVVARGTGGGSGAIAIDRLQLRELPVPPTTPPVPVAQASASERGGGATLAVDGRRDTAWRAPAAGRPQWLELDLGYQREFGGLTLVWQPGLHASDYDVALSRDRNHWTTVRRVRGGNGGDDPIRLPESEARYLRLLALRGPASNVALAEVKIEALEFGESLNGFVAAIAQRSPRGRFPRSFTGEQSYWTLVAVDAARDSGLFSEDGAFEIGRGGASIEPFVIQGDRVFSWADVSLQHRLGEGYLPLPEVSWHSPEWRLGVRMWASGSAEAPRLRARYTLENLTERALELTLVLAVRPFQVNPPTQSLNLAGGVSPIHELSWHGSELSLGGPARIRPVELPEHVGLSRFDAGGFPEAPLETPGLAPRKLTDPTGLASATLVYPLTLAPRARVDRWLTTGTLPEGEKPSPAVLEREARAVAQSWQEKLNRVRFSVPAEAQLLVDTLRSALAHMLMSRAGPVLRPGPRSYARSWIRDGAMMSESLLRLGHADVARDYLTWYAPFQFDSGKVPCCVDARGADPVAENDSAGQFIFLAAEVHRYTGDRTLASSVWPQVNAAARYLEGLRQAERGPQNQTPDRRHYFGLLPPSISHEGYSDKPAYSYWDDFWALIGFEDAAYLARAQGEREAAARLEAERDEFRRELLESLRASAAHHGIDFLPGAADRGDFDPTSTTIALAPGREQATLPPDLLLATFERYYDEFRARRDGQRDWQVYTPYELRSVGTFVRLGWRERAQELLQFFLADRRPAAWNQWAEVVARAPREPHFIGDMPHAWIASDFIRSMLDCFAYERPADHALVLAAGVPEPWLEGEGIRIEHLNTAFGQVSYSLKLLTRQPQPQPQRRLELELRGDAPAGGFVLPWPLAAAPGQARINGKPVHWDGRELRIAKSPSRASIEFLGEPRKVR